MQHFSIPESFLKELCSRTAKPSLDGERLPRISVVMPSFNQARFIERSILSVLNQGYPNLQFIIIDGGSNDGTVKIIKKYEALLDYWVSEPDRGQSDALNKGFEQANGDIYGWLNADDVYLPGALQHIVKSYNSHRGRCSVIFGDWLIIDESDQLIDYCYAFDFSLGQMIYETWHLHPQAMFWSAMVHERFGSFDTELHTNMDVHFVIQVGKNEGESRFLRVPFVLAGWRRHEEQKTGHSQVRARKETYLLEQRYGLGDRHSFLGVLRRIVYRGRRAYWYLHRGGPRELMKRSKNAVRSLLINKVRRPAGCSVI